MEGIGKPVEGESARERHHVPAIDEPAAEAALRLSELVEMDARRVLIEPRRDLMLGLLHGDAVDMVDALAHGVVTEAARAAGKLAVIGRDIEWWTGVAERAREHGLRQPRHVVGGRGRRFVAFAHHY